MKVYFDNNVLIDYEEGKISFPRVEGAKYYYSYVHLDELIESGDKFENLRDKRLDSILKLTHGNFLLNNEFGSIVSIINSPVDILRRCFSPKYQSINNRLSTACHDFGSGLDREKLIKDWGIDVRKLNNYTADEILFDFGCYLLLFLKSTSNSNQEEFQAAFNFFDLIGFWRDKLTERSNMARSYDANHAYFASYCDYFVTNDKRTMNKANVVYQLMEINTVSLSYDDFASQLIIQ